MTDSDSGNECMEIDAGAGLFHLRPKDHLLLKDGQPIKLDGRTLELLLSIAKRVRDKGPKEGPNILLLKDELLADVWPEDDVNENNLSLHIGNIRKVLGRNAVKTVHKRGYRFIALVSSVPSRAPDSAPAPALRTDPEPSRLKTNLPSELRPRHGSKDDLAELSKLIDDHRLVTLIGAGGMGKTLLAQHLLAARENAYTHGVCWVELAALTESSAVPAAIASVLRVPTGPDDPLDGLCNAIASLTLLLGLDNAEHLLPGLAPVIRDLVARARGVRIVVTSQKPLKVAGERLFRIQSLALPPDPLPDQMPASQALQWPAVALFVDRAQAVDHRFVLHDVDAPAAIGLCRSLGGCPLAIELAAARAPMLRVPSLAEELNHMLMKFKNRDGDAPARQQTLRATFEWSHRFLDESERTVFRRMSVMSGSASLELIKQVVAERDGDLDKDAVVGVLDQLFGVPPARLLDFS